MKEKISPGLLWVVCLIALGWIIVLKYKYKNLLEFDIAYALLLLVFIASVIYTYLYDSYKLRSMSIAAFIFGFFFWIPLLNLIFGLLAIYIGIKSLRRVKQSPEKYGGKWFSIIGIFLGTIVYATYLTGLGMCLLGYKIVCTGMGLNLLA